MSDIYNQFSDDQVKALSEFIEESSSLTNLEFVALEIYKEKLRLDKTGFRCLNISESVQEAKELLELCKK